MTLAVRNPKTGVTVKDALDAIHKKFKNKAEDEVPEGVLKELQWDPTEIGTKGWGELLVVLSNK